MSQEKWNEYCLRRAVEISPVAGESGVRRYIVRDSETGEEFEFGEAEIFLCRSLDGTTTVNEIVRAFESRFNLHLSESDAEAFFQELAGYGLLEICRDDALDVEYETPGGIFGEAEDRKAQTSSRNERRREVSGPAFRYSFFNPNDLFSLLARWLYPLRLLAWLLIPGVPLALFILLFNQHEYLFDLDRLGRTYSFGAFLFVFLFHLVFVNLFSKVVQGIVASHFGAPIEQFGLRLAFGIKPRFFVSKAGIWKLHRRGRLLGFGSALLARLSLFVIGILLWAWTFRSSPTLSSISLLAAHAGLFVFLFTANPLWRADGYAWLITYLELPRLRERAFVALKRWITREPTHYEYSSHERYALIAFAVATIAFFVFFIGGALVMIATVLEARLQGTGVVLFLILFTLFLRWMLVALGSRTIKARARELRRKSARRRIGKEFESKELPETGSDLLVTFPVRKEAAPRSVRDSDDVRMIRKRGGRNLLGWLVFFAILGAVSVVPYPYQTGGELILEPLDRADARARFTGEVVKVFIKEGEWVKAGQVVAEIDDWAQQHAVNISEAELEKKQAELGLLKHGAKAEEIAYAREQLEMAKVKADYSRKLEKELKRGKGSNAVSGVTYTQAAEEAAVDDAAVAVAKSNLARTESGPLDMEIKVVESDIKVLTERLNEERAELERTRIVSPISGQVVTSLIDQKKSVYVKEGDVFATVEDTRELRVDIMVPETDIQDVRVGSKIEFKVWSSPGKTFHSEVKTISPRVEESEENPFMNVVRVSAFIENPDTLLKSDMTGFAKIQCGTKPLGVAFGRMVIRFFLIEVWSWIP